MCTGCLDNIKDEMPGKQKATKNVIWKMWSKKEVEAERLYGSIKSTFKAYSYYQVLIWAGGFQALIFSTHVRLSWGWIEVELGCDNIIL